MSDQRPSAPARPSRRRAVRLTAGGAFVVQLSREAAGTHASFRGRAEHVVSGHATHFETLEELLAFIQGELAGQRQSSDSAEGSAQEAAPGARRSEE